ncbi:MAG: hypothetical protein V1813_04345 [Candidatus Aenigmatarchaeota archaeon]
MMGQDSSTIFPEIPREEDIEPMGTGYAGPGVNAGSTINGMYPTKALDAQIIPSAESPNGPSWAKNYNMD